MTTKATAVNTPSTLIEDVLERTRLSRLQVPAAAGLSLLLFLILCALLAGVFSLPFDASFWRAGLLYPVVVVYILSMVPVLRRLRNAAIEGFRPLARMSDDEFNRVLAEAPIFNRRLEWLALGAGIAGGLLLWRPWDLSGPSRIWMSWGASPSWLVVYALLAGGLMTGLLGWSIYSSLSGMRLFTGLQHYPLDINVFDLRPLQPIGRWSLSRAGHIAAG